MYRLYWTIGLIASIGLFAYIIIDASIHPVYAFPLGGFTGLCLTNIIFGEEK